MKESHTPAEDQATLWNNTAGHGWVAAQAITDTMFAPFDALLAGAVIPAVQRDVLDIGCGTGSTTLAIARRLPGGNCVGVDISAPMIAAAQQRTAHEGISAHFLCADAQAYPFAAAAFDLIVSRFGVMFFDDSVQAFANLRRATCDGGELRFIAWRSADENPFMTTAERAAAPLFPGLPPRDPDAPGQFAFADSTKVTRILEQADWSDIVIQPIDVACSFPAQDLHRFLTTLGPLGRRLQDADAETIARVMAAVLPAFAPYVGGSEVRYNAACWMVTGRAGARC